MEYKFATAADCQLITDKRGIDCSDQSFFGLQYLVLP